MRIDLTAAEAQEETGKLRLYGGGYDRTIVIQTNFVANSDEDGTVDVYFDSVPPGASYSLSYIAANGTETVIVQNASFSSLQDNKKPAESSSAPDPQAPAPDPGSQESTQGL